ncbi:fimbria/pilus outer membrane usher protein [Paraburkholderia sp. MMS20-SJTN17]|uniref:Fimbria/pilus outer membrane usher protein n=1 Tax=Paraburkholderia translucens TaxID=2886945 RepID=A0ABS8KA20_9BURK|nr:fimbria/pilus outer membrane usher protein [Paraburkholderia sp. MMS20-SJTN17]MCC8401574.1 fimbria/pilus outer membrane usher protein [Paraburkholderia sp. MMS20-SJTN17]
MTTLKRRRCQWTVLAASLSLVAGVLSPAWSAAPPADIDSSRGQDLYLEVAVNHVELRRIEHFVVRDGHIYTDANTLLGLGLTWPGAATASGLVDLTSLPNLQTQYDVANQRLEIFAPVELLSGPPSEVGYATPPVPHLDPATRAPGLLLNYDFYTQRDNDTTSASGWTELRLFGVGPGIWRTSNLTQLTRGYGTDSERNIRLDTSWQLDFPDSMTTVTMGDALSGALSWTRTMRFGGLRISRNFELQPYRVTVPLASFVGETAVPSLVDLYINGVRQAQGPVAPGQFQVVGAPVISGAGTAQIVVTDITGQRRVVNIPFYNSTRLLQKGLSDWSFEVGALRLDYGIRSFSYADNAMFSGSGRYGVTDYLTLEAHGETSHGLTMGGVGAAVRLGQAGVISASFATSNHGSRRGQQYGAGYEWRGYGFSVNLSTLRRNDAFQDIGTLEGSTLPLSSSQAFLGWNLGRGQLGASFVHQTYQDLPGASYAGLSWSQSFGRFGYFSVGANRDLEGHGGTTAYAYWSLPLGNRVQTWASAVHQGRGNTGTVGAAQSIPGDSDGWGWRVQASAGEDAGGQAEISQLTRFGQWRLGGQYLRNQSAGNSTVYADVTGGVLLMQGHVFPMRRVYDAFALVSTDGIAGVPVKLENRLIGTTDDNGLLLVTPLNAWQNNDLSIDPRGLPADVSVERVRMQAVPSTGSGMLARFEMQTMLMLDFSVHSVTGEAIPAGTQAVLDPGSLPVTIGYDGRVFLENPPAGARLSVPLNTGQCVATLPDTLPQRGRIDLGDQPCR